MIDIDTDSSITWRIVYSVYSNVEQWAEVDWSWWWRYCLSVCCMQALIFAALGRAADAIQTLRVIIEQDVPDHVRRRDEVFQEVVSRWRHNYTVDVVGGMV